MKTILFSALVLFSLQFSAQAATKVHAIYLQKSANEKAFGLGTSCDDMTGITFLQPSETINRINKHQVAIKGPLPCKVIKPRLDRPSICACDCSEGYTPWIMEGKAPADPVTLACIKVSQ